jgi:hypothetical protein
MIASGAIFILHDVRRPGGFFCEVRALRAADCIASKTFAHADWMF